MADNLPEAPVTMFTNYKRKDGFEVSLTLRGNSLLTVAKELSDTIDIISKAGGTPLSLGRGGFGKSQAGPTKPCPVHQVDMKEKTSKSGEKFFSHSRGTFPNLEYCNGKGFPDELKAQEGDEVDVSQF